MKCVKCGKLNEAGAAFCNQCSARENFLRAVFVRAAANSPYAAC